MIQTVQVSLEGWINFTQCTCTYTYHCGYFGRLKLSITHFGRAFCVMFDFQTNNAKNIPLLHSPSLPRLSSRLPGVATHFWGWRKEACPVWTSRMSPLTGLLDGYTVVHHYFHELVRVHVVFIHWWPRKKVFWLESIKITSMEDISTGVIEKNKEYLRVKDKAEKWYDVSRHI